MKYIVTVERMPKRMNKGNEVLAEQRYNVGTHEEGQVLGVLHDEWMRYRKISQWMKFGVKEES